MNINDFKEWLLTQEHVGFHDNNKHSYTMIYYKGNLRSIHYVLYTNNLEIIKIEEECVLVPYIKRITLEELMQKIER